MISGELLYLQTINADWNVKLIISVGVPTKVLIRFFLLMGGFSLRTSTSTDPLVLEATSAAWGVVLAGSHRILDRSLSSSSFDLSFRSWNQLILRTWSNIVGWRVTLVDSAGVLTKVWALFLQGIGCFIVETSMTTNFLDSEDQATNVAWSVVLACSGRCLSLNSLKVIYCSTMWKKKNYDNFCYKKELIW